MVHNKLIHAMIQITDSCRGTQMMSSSPQSGPLRCFKWKLHNFANVSDALSTHTWRPSSQFPAWWVKVTSL